MRKGAGETEMRISVSLHVVRIFLFSFSSFFFFFFGFFIFLFLFFSCLKRQSVCRLREMERIAKKKEGKKVRNRGDKEEGKSRRIRAK